MIAIPQERGGRLTRQRVFMGLLVPHRNMQVVDVVSIQVRTSRGPFQVCEECLSRRDALVVRGFGGMRRIMSNAGVVKDVGI